METGIELSPSHEQLARDIGLAEPIERLHPWRNRLARVAALGAVALAAGSLVWHHYNGDNSFEYYPPTAPNKVLADTINNDGVQRYISWNVAGYAALYSPQIKYLRAHYRADGLALQEVTGNDAKLLRKLLPDSYVVYKEADGHQQPTEGGYGDALITWQRPRDLKGKLLPGNGYLKTVVGWATGLGQDVAHADTGITDTRNGFQEKREVMAVTLETKIAGRTVPVRLMNGHIAGHVDRPLHNRQAKDIFQFMKDNSNKKYLSVFIGDLNSENPEVRTLAKKYGLTSPATGATTRTGKSADHVVYTSGPDFGPARFTILPRPDDASDHNPIEVEYYPKTTSSTRG